MTSVVGNFVYGSDGRTLAYVIGKSIYDRNKQMLAYMSSNYVYGGDDQVLAYMSGNYIFDHDNQRIGDIGTAKAAFPHPDDHVAAALYMLSQLGYIKDR